MKKQPENKVTPLAFSLYRIEQHIIHVYSFLSFLMENGSFDEVIKCLRQNYYKLYPDMDIVPDIVIVTGSLSKSHLELRPDAKEKFNMNEIENQDNAIGRMGLPKVVGDDIYILLNYNEMVKYTEDDSMAWISTYAHELTHAIDYHRMALKENLNIYDSLNETSEYCMFQLWSEYHAKKLGCRFLRNQLNVDIDANDEMDRIQYILNVEWPYYKEYHQAKDTYKEIYVTMRLLARYSVWCDLFPNPFNESAFKKIFVDIPWIYNIFAFLRQHNSLDIVYPKFGDMRLLLKETWQGL